MQDSPPEKARDSNIGRWELMRDVLKFQLKLLMDGLRDVLMSPLSLIAAVAGLLLEPSHPGRYFQRALDFGRRTEVWINLFDRTPGEDDDAGIDELFRHLETKLIEHHQRGGMTSGAKRAVDGSLDRLHRAVSSVRRHAASGENAAGKDQTTDDSGS